MLFLWLAVLCLLSQASLLKSKSTFDDSIDESSVPVPAWPVDYSWMLTNNEKFDYVVVGAGAAGTAAASRLALAGYRTLLVEAGGDPTLLTRIPGAAQALFASSVDWAYETISNNMSCLSSMKEQCRFTRGKCLGGSTSINFMLYVRGNRRDFDDWGVPGWTWDDMKQYYLRYEGLQVLDEFPSSSKQYHNTTGILKIEFFGDSGNAWHKRFFKGFQTLNFPINPDCNGKSQIGVTQSIGYVYKGERMSTARAYLLNDDVKKTLYVAKNTKCSGVIIDKNNVARGITVITSGYQKLNILTTKEVILSAGTVGTPQILMLSGVGPAEHLKEMGIEVKVNLPVGEDMSDHVLALVFLKVDRGFGVDAFNLFAYGVKGAQAIQWLATKDGPLASNGLTDITGIFNTKCYDYENRQLTHNRSDCDLPTSQYIYSYVDRGLLPGGKVLAQPVFGFKDEAYNQISDANVEHAIITVSNVVLRPDSRGYIRLKSTNPLDDPAIYSNYLSNTNDVEEILRCITVMEHLVETPAFKKNHAEVLRMKLQDCVEYDEDREEYWRCYSRHMTYSVYHAVGTAGLGRVVDERLRVKGVGRLRVADLSVVPLMPRGNTEATAVAVGERVADLVQQDLKE